MSIQNYIDKQMKNVCPIHGVSFGKLNDKTTWEIHFYDTATAEQKAAAQKVIDDFEWTAELQEMERKAVRDEQYKNDLTMRQCYVNYGTINPNATFSAFLDYLESL